MFNKMIKRASVVLMAAMLTIMPAADTYAKTYDYDIIKPLTTYSYTNGPETLDKIVNILGQHTYTDRAQVYNTGLHFYYEKEARKAVYLLRDVLFDPDLKITYGREAAVLSPREENGRLYYVSDTPYLSDTLCIYVGWNNAGDNSAAYERIKATLDHAKEVVASAPEGTREERIRYFFEYLCKTVSVQRADSVMDQSPYNVFFEHAGCCKAYAGAFTLLCGLAGYQIGQLDIYDDTMNHCLNYICLPDAGIRFIDITFADAPQTHIDENYYLFPNEQYLAYANGGLKDELYR